LDKSDIFFIGRGGKVYYESIGYQIYTNIYESNFNFLKKAGIHFTYKKFTDKNEAEHFLLNNIDTNLLISIRVNTRYLTYHTAFQNVIPSPHFINSLAVDITSRKIYISDGCVPTLETSIYQGWTDLDDILNAWSVYNYSCIVLNLDSIVTFRKGESAIKFLAKEEFTRFIKKYLKYNLEVNSWSYAIYRLFDDLKFCLDKFNKNELYEFTTNIVYQLKFCGFLTTKKYILEFIKNNEFYNLFYNEYDNNVAKWSHIDKHILKVGITGEHEYLDALLEKISSICNEESNILSKLMAL